MTSTFLSETEIKNCFPNIVIGDNCKIGNNVKFGDNVTIGDYVKINGNIVIGDNVIIGDYVKINGNVTIDANCIFGDYTSIDGDITFGQNCKVHKFCIFENICTIEENVSVYSFTNIGTNPQALFFEGEDSKVFIGKNSQIREGCMIHRGTNKENLITSIGQNCYMMCGSHIGHDTQIGDDVTFGPNCLLGGHTKVGSNVRFSGNISVVPFSRIGDLCMIGANCKVSADVPHFSLVTSDADYVKGLNLVGLKRSGIEPRAVKEISRAYNEMLKSDIPVKEAAEKYLNHDNDKVKMIAEFILSKSENGLQRR